MLDEPMTHVVRAGPSPLLPDGVPASLSAVGPSRPRAPTVISDHLPTRNCPFAKTVSVRAPGGVDGESTPLVSE
jgi:hypothetical protein